MIMILIRCVYVIRLAFALFVFIFGWLRLEQQWNFPKSLQKEDFCHGYGCLAQDAFFIDPLMTFSSFGGKKEVEEKKIISLDE